MSSPSPTPLRSPAKKSDAEKTSARGVPFKRDGRQSPQSTTPAVASQAGASPSAPQTGTVRARLSSPTRLVTEEAPNLRLDPFGVAGTGTARRLRTARVRRQWQLLVGSVAIATIFCGSVSLLLRPQSPTLWAQPTREVPFVQSAPAAQGSGVAYVPALDGTLWRVNPRTGAVQKLKGTGGFFPARVAPLVAGPRAFVASLDGTLTAFNLKTSAVAWKQSLGGTLSTTPVATRNGLIVAANDAGHIMALRASDGRRGWTAQASGPVGDALAATREGIVVPSLPSAHGRGALECFDTGSGKRRWRFPQNILDAAPGVTAPIFDTGRNLVFWASDYGFVVALDATTGAKFWKTFATPLADAPSRTVTLRGAPTLWQNTLLVGGNDGTVRAFNAQNGRPRWTQRLEGAVTLPARIVQCEGKIVASVSDGHELALLDIATGQIVRRLALANQFGAIWLQSGGWIQDTSRRAWRLGAF